MCELCKKSFCVDRGGISQIKSRAKEQVYDNNLNGSKIQMKVSTPKNRLFLKLNSSEVNIMNEGQVNKAEKLQALKTAKCN